MSELTKFSKDAIRSAMESLPNTHRVAFAAMCGERQFSSYALFSSEADWGEPSLLREGLEMAWTLAMGTKVDPERVQALADKIYEVIPDTEDFDAEHTNLALGAASAVVYALRAYVKDGVENAVWAASAVFDALYIHVGLDDDEDHDAESHPLVQREILQQRADIDVLSSSPVISLSLVERMKSEIQT